MKDRMTLREAEVLDFIARAGFKKKSFDPFEVSSARLYWLTDELNRLPNVLTALRKRKIGKELERLDSQIFDILKRSQNLKVREGFEAALESLQFLESLAKREAICDPIKERFQKWIAEACDLEKAISALIPQRGEFEMIWRNFSGGPEAFLISKIVPKILSGSFGFGEAEDRYKIAFLVPVLIKLGIKAPQSREVFTAAMIRQIWKKYSR